MVRFLDKHKHGVGQKRFARMYLTSFGIHTRFVQTAQKGRDHNLLITLINLVELQYSTLSWFENLWQIKMLHVVKGKAIHKTLVNTPGQRVYCARIVSAFAIIVTFLFGYAFDSSFKICYCPGSSSFSIIDFAQSAAQKVLLFLCHLR